MQKEGEKRVRRVLVVMVALSQILYSCSGEKAKDLAPHAVRNFVVEEIKTPYSLSLYARMARGERDELLPLKITITTPSGERYSEELSLPLKLQGVEGRRVESGMWRDYLWSYREGVTFQESGEWSFKIKYSGEEQKKSKIKKLGIIIVEQ